MLLDRLGPPGRCRLLAARRRGRRRRRRRFRLSDFRFEAAAATLSGTTLSGTGSASPRPDRTSWLRGWLRRAFTPAFRAGSLYPFIPWRVGAEQAGAAKLRSMAS